MVGLAVVDFLVLVVAFAVELAVSETVGSKYSHNYKKNVINNSNFIYNYNYNYQ